MHAQFLEGSQDIPCSLHFQRLAGMGYLSSWADDQFSSVSERINSMHNLDKFFHLEGMMPCKTTSKIVLEVEVISLAQRIMSA